MPAPLVDDPPVDFDGSDDDSSQTASSLDSSESSSDRSERAIELRDATSSILSSDPFQQQALNTGSDPQLSPDVQAVLSTYQRVEADLGTLNDRMQRVSDALGTDLPKAIEATAPKAQNNAFWNTASLLLGGGGLLVLAGNFLYAIVYNATRHKPNPELDALADDLQKKALAVAEQWAGLEPADIWPQVAVFATTKNPNITCQLLILGFIKQLSPPPVDDGVEWTYRADDFNTQVEQLQAIYDGASGDASDQAAAMYEALTTVEYDGYTEGTDVVVPTPVGAELASYVLMNEQLDLGG